MKDKRLHTFFIGMEAVDGVKGLGGGVEINQTGACLLRANADGFTVLFDMNTAVAVRILKILICRASADGECQTPDLRRGIILL